MGLFALPLILVSGCNTGSRNEVGPGGPTLDPSQPFVTSISPEGGAPGDLITVSGRNFSTILEENHVYFTNANGSINIPGRVESVIVGNFVEGEGSPSTMTVRVPTGARSGFLNVEVDNVLNPNTGLTQDGVPAGARGFTGAPVVLGYAINDDGLGFAIRQPFGVLQPDTVVLIGYNLINNVTDVFIADDQASSIPADDITNGVPFSANYTLPTGLEGITVTLPSGLVVDGNCTAQALELTAVASGLGLSGSATPFFIPLGAPASNSGIAPYVTGAGIPAGIRSGIVDMAFTYASDPSETLWDATFEYRDPTDPTGNTWLPLTEDPTQLSPTTARLMPGSSSQVSDIGNFIGPGATYVLHWDTAADIPPSLGLVRTQIRILFDEASGGVSLFTPSCVPDYISPVIVINNDIDPAAAIVEEFNNNNQQGPATTALWNSQSNPGVLTAAPGLPVAPAYGNGTDDIVLADGGEYVIDTDAVFILDLTDPFNPVDLLSNNPGAAAGEFHVRSLIIEDGADVTWQGENPVLFRVSGDGTDSFIAARVELDIAFDGESAVDATSASNTPGGAAGICGGAAGGDGAFIEIDGANLLVDSIDPAGRGELNGGYGGASSTYVTGTGGSSSPRAGCGGGGGHADWGDDAVNALYEDPASNAITMPPALGGPPRGNKFLTSLTGGAGGGGGGSVAVFANNNISARHGGGGGGGGGAFGIVARGSVQLLGTISCKGGDGAKGSPGQQSGAGGGGAGGSILVRATGNVEFGTEAFLDVAGGFGGVASSSTINPVNGGNGSDGRIAIQGNLLLPGSNEADFTPQEGTPGISIGVFSVGTLQAPTPAFVDLDGSILNPVGLPAVSDPNDDNFGLVEFVIDTDLGEVRDPSGTVLFTNPGLSATPPTDPWVFEIRDLEIPQGAALVGRGSMPLVLRVSGVTTIDGTLDVSGEAGGAPDFTDPLNPLPGLGGAPGAGGGAGGDGGTVVSSTEVGAPQAGGLPASIPSSLLASTPPLGGDGGTGTPVPSSGILPAQPGASSLGTGGCDGSSGGGGGFLAAGLNAGSVGGCTPGGDGGNAYGSNFFLVVDPESPSAAIELRAGGGGGAGGGAYANGTILSPGSGGGGGGGFVEIFGRGPIFVGPTAVLRARGGDAVRAPSNAGNGGAGAGGAIRIRGLSTVQLSVDALVDSEGGLANLEPGVSYPNGPTAQFTAGDGSDGRVRIETPLGFTDGGGQDIGPYYLGPFATAELRERVAISRPYRLVASDGSTLIGGASFPFLSDPAKFLGTLPAGTEARVFYEAAQADPASPSIAGEFYGPIDDTTQLDRAEFIRLRISLFTTETEAPVIESVTLPFNQ